jgi:hypothetical protein
MSVVLPEAKFKYDWYDTTYYNYYKSVDITDSNPKRSRKIPCFPFHD